MAQGRHPITTGSAGAPTDVQGAEALKEISPHQFEWWAVDLVNARPAKDHKKGTDTGIDGYINFFDDKSKVAQTWFLSLRLFNPRVVQTSPCDVCGVVMLSP